MARQLVEGFVTGLHKSPYHGFSVEFAEHRLYNPGQSTRHIDWKVLARTDRLFTRSYEEETNLRCMLMVDQSPSMFYPKPGHRKFQFAVEAAAAIAWLLHLQRDATGLCLFDSEVRSITQPRSTRSGLDKLFISLETARQHAPGTQGISKVAEVLHEIAEKIHRRSLIVLFTDMFDQSGSLDTVMRGLQHLRHNKHEVLIFHVFDGQTESRLDFDDRPHRFIDLETGETLKLNPADIRQAFEKRLEDFQRELDEKCAQLRIDLVRCDVRNGIIPVLQSYLIKRGRMN